MEINGNQRHGEDGDSEKKHTSRMSSQKHLKSGGRKLKNSRLNKTISSGATSKLVAPSPKIRKHQVKHVEELNEVI